MAPSTVSTLCKTYSVAGTDARLLVATQTAANARLSLHSHVGMAVRRLLCVELAAAGCTEALDMLVNAAKAKEARALIACSVRLAMHGGSQALLRARTAVATLQRDKLTAELKGEAVDRDADSIESVAKHVDDDDDDDTQSDDDSTDNDNTDDDDDDDDESDDALAEVKKGRRQRSLVFARQSAKKHPQAAAQLFATATKLWE